MSRIVAVCGLFALALLVAMPAQGQRTARGKKYAFLVACSDYTAGEFRKLKGTVAEMKDGVVIRGHPRGPSGQSEIPSD